METVFRKRTIAVPVKAYIESHGCTMNYGEGREAESRMRAGGVEICPNPSDADVLLLNTCAVIEFTENTMLRRLRELHSLGKMIVVTGCMAPVRRESILSAAPGAFLYGPGEHEMLDALLGLNLSADTDCWNSPGRNDIIIPIAQGCLSRCTYCFSRIARPRLRSIDPEKIVGEVKKSLVGGKTREILLSGMDSITYGRDRGTTLPALLKKVCAIEGDFMVRVGMMNPSLLMPLMDELLDAYSSEKVYKFFHIPFQSGSDRILRLMKRGNTAGQFLEIVRKVRNRYPDLTLSTDLIVGFPGETEEDFSKSLEIISETEPDIVNVTRFSAREGTEAAGMTGRVPGWKAKEWSRQATALRFRISARKNLEFTGREMRVLITEKGRNGSMIGRTASYRQVIVPGEYPLGESIMCRAVSSTPIHIVCEPLTHRSYAEPARAAAR
ncbi:MAG: tRNA (N(6)-L-threonylcarbamoyladenosine(37)-C(2))-methylthiotransferase [Methanomassiliicoccales archaeon]|nr:tRNA (N(6)-L-threonylcarbamoyladenosine(37)-C(2))-methylthiotransferase [Methanomassiliicoccales archaeon]